jgi:hypothetical protein
MLLAEVAVFGELFERLFIDVVTRAVKHLLEPLD